MCWWPHCYRKRRVSSLHGRHPGLDLLLVQPSSDSLSACSGKFAPIPACYSRDLHALVAALLQKAPESRPCMADILDLVAVRTHLRAYASHIGLSSKPAPEVCLKLAI